MVSSVEFLIIFSNARLTSGDGTKNCNVDICFSNARLTSGDGTKRFQGRSLEKWFLRLNFLIIFSNARLTSGDGTKI